MIHTVNGKGKSYSATGLDDLSRFFEGMAQKEEQLSRGALTQREKAKHQAAANAYRDAAGVTADTELSDGVSIRVSNEALTQMLAASMEWGYKAHEAGRNIESARAAFAAGEKP